MPSFLSGWGFRKAIKYGTTKPGSNLTSFPTLLKIVADTDIGAVLSTRKFAVTDTDGTTQLAYGNYNDFVVSAGACTATLRFKQSLSSAAATGDVLGYLYYDQSQTDQANRAGSLPSGRILFMPMEEDPSGGAPQMVDWSGNHNGTTQGSMTSGQLVSGEVGSAIQFNANSSQYISIADSSDLRLLSSTPFTISLWAKANGSSTTPWAITKKSTGYPQIDGWECYAQTDGGGNWYFDFLGDYGDNAGNLSRAFITADTNWHRFDIYFDGSTMLNLLDSVSQTLISTYANSPIIQTGTDPLWIGVRDALGTSVGVLIDGRMDEVTIDTVARSQDWITYAYQNDKNNSATVTLGAQETAPAGGTYIPYDLQHSPGFQTVMAM